MSDEEKISGEHPGDEPVSLARDTGGSTAKSKATLNETPNGGFRAWLQVAGAFCLYFNTWYSSIISSKQLLVNKISRYQGHHQHVRGFPDLLPVPSSRTRIPIQHILGGLYPSISLVPWRRHCWPILRPWLSQAASELRDIYHCVWDDDDQYL